MSAERDLQNPPARRPRNVTLGDVATHCGLTATGVSMALRDHPRIAHATRTRVQQAANALGYDPTLHLSARRLRQHRGGPPVANNVLAVLTPDRALETAYFRRLITGIQAAAADSAILLVRNNVAPDAPPPARQRVFQPLLRGEIDGWISFGTDLELTQVDTLRQHAGLRHVPGVLIAGQLPGLSCVLPDVTPGLTAAVQHLLTQGHRSFLRLLFGKITGPVPPPADERSQVIQTALTAAGLDPRQHYQAFATPDYWMDPYWATQHLADISRDSAAVALTNFLQAHPAITALLGDNDATALHAFAALRQAGRSVPQDYSLLGFDDTDPLPADQGANRLSSVAVPLEEMGARAVAAVRENASGSAEPSPILLPTRFVLRVSLGPART